MEPSATQIITIDGPAGCGKSTVACSLAKQLGGLAFSSGAIYRAVTYLALENGVDLEQPQQLVALIQSHKLCIEERGGELKVLIDGKDPGSALKSSRVTREIHWIADAPQVREALLPLQRAIGSPRPVIAEGRDLGTVVFPEARIKIFLTATVEERVRRRHQELRAKLGEEINFARVYEEVERRDRFDRERSEAPLKVPDGAMEVDTTGLSVSQVVAEIIDGIRQDGVAKPPG
ncbi:MAG: (d)CMP kinase [Planctomycetota bacterium]